MTFYPQCGLGVRELEESEVRLARVTRLLETTMLRRVPLRTGQWVYFDGNAAAKGINVNKRVTVLLRTIDAALLRDMGGVMRGHAIVATEQDHRCLK